MRKLIKILYQAVDIVSNIKILDSDHKQVIVGNILILIKTMYHTQVMAGNILMLIKPQLMFHHT